MVFWLKLFLMPALIGAVTWAGKRWGPNVIGWVVGLPVVGGPILFCLALEQGSAFAATAAQAALTGMTALSAYCLTYGIASRRFPWMLCLLCGWTAYFTVASLLPQIPHITLALAATAGFGSLTIGVLAFPRIHGRTKPVSAPPSEILIRMLAATGLLLAITTLANRLGPQWSGILTPFPVLASVLPAFTHRSAGADAAATQIRGILMGLYSFALFFLIVGASVQKLGISAAFLAASAASLILHAASLQILPKRT